MELWTIGTFAKASRLSPKALRLYDELGLLTPAQVDPLTGYRFYAPDQLEGARLVAWLRRLGMPLPQIRAVCALEPAAAAKEVSVFWTQVEAETDARRELAAVLIDHLGLQGDRMPEADRLGIRYAVGSDIGLVRDSNQDTAYADSGLLAVADGFGVGGAPASTAAINALVDLAAGARLYPGDLLNALQDAVSQANERIGDLCTGSGEGDALAGTTLTAMVWTGSALALVHIGDSRAYLLREGGFFQITQDHSLVQSLVDDGRLTPAEAASHHQRALLLRALDGRAGSVPDVRLHDARLSDRYLLCSDGVSAVVATEEIRRVLVTVTDPQQAVAELLATVRRNGAPDNASCVIADVTGQAPVGAVTSSTSTAGSPPR
jgi:serine/threonine protein phosphatase PrpC